MKKNIDPLLDHSWYTYASIFILVATIFFAIGFATAPARRKSECQELIQELERLQKQNMEEQRNLFKEAFEKGILEEELYKEIISLYIDLEKNKL